MKNEIIRKLFNGEELDPLEKVFAAKIIDSSEDVEKENILLLLEELRPNILSKLGKTALTFVQEDQSEHGKHCLYSFFQSLSGGEVLVCVNEAMYALAMKAAIEKELKKSKNNLKK